MSYLIGPYEPPASSWVPPASPRAGVWQDSLQLRVAVGVTGILANDPYYWEPTTRTDSRWGAASWSQLIPRNPSTADPDAFVWHEVPCQAVFSASWSSGVRPWQWNDAARVFEVRIHDPAGEWHPAGRVGGGLGIRPGVPVWIGVRGELGVDGALGSGLDLTDRTLDDRQVAFGQLRSVRLEHTPAGGRVTVWSIVSVPGVYGSVNGPALGTTPTLNFTAQVDRIMAAAADAGLPAFTNRQLWSTVWDETTYQGTEVAQSIWAELARLVNSSARRLVTWSNFPGPVAVPAWRPAWDDDDGGDPIGTRGYGPNVLTSTRDGIEPPVLRPWITNTCPDDGLVIDPGRLELASTIDNLANVAALANVGGATSTFTDYRSLQVYGEHRWGRTDLLKDPDDGFAPFGLPGSMGSRVLAWRADAVWELGRLVVPIRTVDDFRRVEFVKPGGYGHHGPDWPFYPPSTVIPIVWDDPAGFTWRAPAVPASVTHRVGPAGWRCELELELGHLEVWDTITEEWTDYRLGTPEAS